MLQIRILILASLLFTVACKGSVQVKADTVNAAAPVAQDGPCKGLGGQKYFECAQRLLAAPKPPPAPTAPPQPQALPTASPFGLAPMGLAPVAPAQPAPVLVQGGQSVAAADCESPAKQLYLSNRSSYFVEVRTSMFVCTPERLVPGMVIRHDKSGGQTVLIPPGAMRVHLAFVVPVGSNEPVELRLEAYQGNGLQLPADAKGYASFTFRLPARLPEGIDSPWQDITDRSFTFYGRRR